MSMKFISCASYYGTGSSAITDLVSEYEGVFNFANEEFRFLQDPDGVSELEYNLVENWNRHNSGHALKRYKKLVDFYCGNIFGRKFEGYFHGNWKKYSYQYIDELTDFSFHGYWMYDFYDRGKLYHLWKRLPNKLLTKTIWRNQPDRQLNNMKNEVTLCSAPGEEKFLDCTRRYVDNLFASVCGDSQTVMVDQIVPPNNTRRFLRYFNDLQIIVVDRDPRDVWSLEKYVWKDGVIPHEDVETFCKWYKYTRAHRKHENLETDRVTFVRFEDLIFHYDETVARLEKFLGLDAAVHTKKFTRLDPKKSAVNTQVWRRVNVPAKEIAYIEKELGEYLYPDFPAADKMAEGKPGYV